MNYYTDVLKKYVRFKGRAARKEYWMFTLFNVLAYIVLAIIDRILFGTSQVIVGIYFLAVLLPSLGVVVRRLHDTNCSDWWLLLVLVPIVGPIVLIIFFVLDSQPGQNKYGPNPKGL